MYRLLAVFLIAFSTFIIGCTSQSEEEFPLHEPTSGWATVLPALNENPVSTPTEVPMQGCVGMLFYPSDSSPYLVTTDGPVIKLDPKYGALAPFEPSFAGETAQSLVFVTDQFGRPCDYEPYIVTQAVGELPGSKIEDFYYNEIVNLRSIGPVDTTGLLRHIRGDLWIIFNINYSETGARTGVVNDPNNILAAFSWSEKYGARPPHPKVQVNGKIGPDGIFQVESAQWADQ